MTRNELKELLKNNRCEVTFTKVNGEVRVMPCTLMESELPAQPATATTETKVNEETLSVWCLDKKSWRSFRVANVTKIEVLNHD
jgi:hypothetical protein